MSTQAWAVDESLKTFYLLGQHRLLTLSEPRWVFVTPWFVAFYFTRVQLAEMRISPRWWVCCGNWTDAVAFARCRRLALFWREQGW